MTNTDVVMQLDGLGTIAASAQEEIKRLRALVAGQKGEFVEEAKPPWLIKAAGYLGEKEIRGPKHNPKVVKFWQTIKLPGIRDDETPWCLEGDIEVLTENGFVRFDAFKNSAVKKVAQLNTKTNEVEFTDNFEYVEKTYNGVIYDIQAGRVNLTCDPQHRLYGSFSSSGINKLRAAKTLTKYGVGIPCIASGAEGVSYSNDDLAFLAAYLSDGYINHQQVQFNFSKERKINLIENFNYIKKTKDSKVYGVSNKLLTRYCFPRSSLREEFITNRKTLDWEFVRSLSKEQSKVFIEAYKEFDGTPEGDNFTVFTAIKELQEQLTYIATMAGYKTTPYSTRQVSKNSKIGCLHNVYCSTNERRYIQKKHIKERQYSGKLYCLQVPTEVMIIRCRNGVILPIGNCASFVGACLELAGFVSTRKGNARSYNTWGRKLSKPCVGAIVVFWRGSRSGWKGHVGYLVGIDGQGRWLILGGNQGNAVSIRAYAAPGQPGCRVLDLRWPKGYMLPTNYVLPIGSAHLTDGNEQ